MLELLRTGFCNDMLILRLVYLGNDSKLIFLFWLRIPILSGVLIVSSQWGVFLEILYTNTLYLPLVHIL